MYKLLLPLFFIASISSCGKKCYNCDKIGTYYANDSTFNAGHVETCDKVYLEQLKENQNSITDGTGQKVGSITYVCD